MAAVEGPVVGLQQPPNTNGYHHPLKVDAPVKNPEAVEVKSTVDPEDKLVSKPKFELEDHPIDEVRPIKVGVIGAGLAGISAGVLLPAKVPGLDLRIYDKNADVVC